MGRVYEAGSVASVKKVAVVAVDVVQPEEFNLFNHTNAGGPGPMGQMNIAIATPSEHVDEYADDFRQELKKKRGWNTIPRSEVANNSVIAKYIKDTTEGLQSTQPIPAHMTKFRAPDLLDVDSANKIGQAARDEIMQSLGVDALAFARYDIQLNGTSIMGIGNKHPQANMIVTIYQRGMEKPIWRDQAQGQEMDDSVGKTNITLDFNLMKKLGIESSHKAFGEIADLAGK
jgi:hypothetical protein